jgi:hypothetical protein
MSDSSLEQALKRLPWRQIIKWVIAGFMVVMIILTVIIIRNGQRFAPGNSSDPAL